MDGTHKPMKMAASASPLKYNTSEKMSERKAEINKSISVIVNFLNIVFLILYYKYPILKTTEKL